MLRRILIDREAPFDAHCKNNVITGPNNDSLSFDWSATIHLSIHYLCTISEMEHPGCIDTRPMLYPVTIHGLDKSPSIIIRPKDPYMKKQSRSVSPAQKKVTLLQRTAALCVPCSTFVPVSYKGRPVMSYCIARYVYHRTYSCGI